LLIELGCYQPSEKARIVTASVRGFCQIYHDVFFEIR
jgi:hypothetical protein